MPPVTALRPRRHPQDDSRRPAQGIALALLLAVPVWAVGIAGLLWAVR